jgi:hypothetical protein
MIKTVYTYYELVPKIENCPGRKSSQASLIELCARSWMNNGWNLIVLGENDAKTHELYQEYKEIISLFPSVNPELYDYHCYMRWLAMANIGGGIMIDYDVINMSLKDPSFFNFTGLTVYQGHVPCVVSGSTEDYMSAVKGFMGFKNNIGIVMENNKPHTSDMIMLSSGAIKFNKLYQVKNYPEPGDLVHCSQGRCKNKTKLEIMEELLYDQ